MQSVLKLKHSELATGFSRDREIGDNTPSGVCERNTDYKKHFEKPPAFRPAVAGQLIQVGLSGSHWQVEGLLAIASSVLVAKIRVSYNFLKHVVGSALAMMRAASQCFAIQYWFYKTSWISFIFLSSHFSSVLQRRSIPINYFSFVSSDLLNSRL